MPMAEQSGNFTRDQPYFKVKRLTSHHVEKEQILCISDGVTAEIVAVGMKPR